ncbi:MAG: hypothetical protein JWM50_2261 [Microbacteriaceae bacterium]|jgi:hypothetical protein|nr:hypothetical protein [Microbacteriaceae bacterium]
MPTVISTPTASDFLALVPRLVGFPPCESIVLVAFRGKRTCAAIRFDLPPAAAPVETCRRIATSMVGVLSKLGGADAVVPVVYTGDSFTAHGAPPRAAFVGAALERFRFSGFLVRDALCVAADGWGSFLDPDCPAVGRPLSDIAASAVHDAIPTAERDRLGDIEAWSALPIVDLATTERVARKLRTIAAALGRARVSGRDRGVPPCREAELVRGDVDRDVLIARWQLDDLPAFAEACLDEPPERMLELDAAVLIHAAQSPALRDVLMLQWAFDLETGDRVLDDAGRFAAGEPVLSLETGPLMLGEGPRPDPARIEKALSVVKRLAASAPRASRPPLLCMLAWLNWALGRSSVADRFVRGAESIDHRYGLAEVLRAVLDRGMLPEWAFQLDDPSAGD